METVIIADRVGNKKRKHHSISYPKPFKDVLSPSLPFHGEFFPQGLLSQCASSQL